MIRRRPGDGGQGRPADPCDYRPSAAPA